MTGPAQEDRTVGEGIPHHGVRDADLSDEGTPTPADPAMAAGIDAQTVEEVVRAKLSQALGGRRGMVEGAVPTIGFTSTYLLSHELRLSLGVGIGLAVLLLVVRVVQRS